MARRQDQLASSFVKDLKGAANSMALAFSAYYPVVDAHHRAPERHLVVHVGNAVMRRGGFIYPERWLWEGKGSKELVDFLALYPREQLLVAAECKNLSPGKSDFRGLASDLDKLSRFESSIHDDGRPHVSAVIMALLAMTYWRDIAASWEKAKPLGSIARDRAANAFFRKLTKKGYKTHEPALLGYLDSKSLEFVKGTESATDPDCNLWLLSATLVE